MISARNATRTAWLLIAVFTGIRLLMAATMPLTPQEAYYWTWSQYPDLSYFDHPPLASYMIWLTTAVWGNTTFGIKAAAVAWSLGWNLVWLRLVRDLYTDAKVHVWAILALNLTLLYELYGVGPTPDGPLLLGWAGTIWAVWRATQQPGWRWWLAAGAFLGLALLGKYSAVLLVPVVGLYILTTPSVRHWLFQPQPYVAVALAVLIFSPVLVWNAQHDWVSLAFQSTRRVNQMHGLQPRFFLLLLVTQALLVTPYLFGLSIGTLVANLRAAWRRQLENGPWLLTLSALVPLLVFTLVSLRTNAKINWLMPAWWSLVIMAMAAYAPRLARSRWHQGGLALSATMVLAAVVVSARPDLPIPGDLNIWSGWEQAGRKVDELVAQEQQTGRETFVFSPNYKNSSLIWFHRPSQARTYAQDILGQHALQYGYFPQPSPLKGATGFLVLSNQAQSQLDLATVRPLFDTLTQVASIETGRPGQPTRRIDIWKGTGYQGRPLAPTAADPGPDAP